MYTLRITTWLIRVDGAGIDTTSIKILSRIGHVIFSKKKTIYDKHC